MRLSDKVRREARTWSKFGREPSATMNRAAKELDRRAATIERLKNPPSKHPKLVDEMLEGLLETGLWGATIQEVEENVLRGALRDIFLESKRRDRGV